MVDYRSDCSSVLGRSLGCIVGNSGAHTEDILRRTAVADYKLDRTVVIGRSLHCVGIAVLVGKIEHPDGKCSHSV